jgi:hypothetical protein
MTIGVKQSKKTIIFKIDNSTEPIPDLVLLINPSNLDEMHTSLISESRTLGGFVREFWGEQLGSLTASGRTAIFYDDNGLTNSNMRNSEGYQNFIRLLNIYKNNGKEYVNEKDPRLLATKGNKNRISKANLVIMIYNGKQYYGYFDSFGYKEASDKPYNLEYDFSFKVVRTVGEYIVDNASYVRQQNA